mmetsp:Transcript_34726/g.88899  ORF Transcript_34726/g.88899 Transcript_34726/m.88899 type:complete len:241 (-) Transcript_34726:472-1194(-)
MALRLEVSPMKCCLARVFPSTMGLDASRWEGLGTRERCTGLPDVVGRSIEYPKWYLTSPDPSTASDALSPWRGPSINSYRISSSGLRITFASTLSLPLWGIPMVMWEHPPSTAVSMQDFIPGMKASIPSRPKRFVTPYLVARKLSKFVANTSLSNMLSTSSLERLYPSRTSNLFLIQFCWTWSEMWVNSTPMVRQYAVFSVSRICPRVRAWPVARIPALAAPTAAPPSSKVLFRSSSVNP